MAVVAPMYIGRQSLPLLHVSTTHIVTLHVFLGFIPGLNDYLNPFILFFAQL